MPNGNKGEWSELYAFLKSLISGEVEDNDDSSIINPIIKLSRYECGHDKIYILDKDTIIISERINNKIIIPEKRINAISYKLQLPSYFEEIKKGKGSYSCPNIESVMNVFDIERIKSAANNKDDFKIQFKGSKLRGFNVKSEIGGSAGIINASRRTNFVYEVFSQLIDEELNNLKRPKTIVRTIYNQGGRLEFRKCNKNYKDQLGDAVEIFSLLLLEYFKSKERDVSKLVNKIFGNKPEILNLQKDIWINRISRILTDSGSSIRPSKICHNKDRTASGGLIYVKKDGRVTCDIYSSKDDAGDYLYRTAFFDTASTTRHDFGRIYSDSEGYRAINLNLNIKGST